MALDRRRHAVRRLTDESTNVNCTPPGRPEPRFREPEDRRYRAAARWPDRRTGAHTVAASSAGSRPRSLVAARCSRPRDRRRLWRRGQPRRGAARGGDRRRRRCSASRRSRPRTRPGSGARTPVADAAGTASADYPGQTRGSRPRAVTLVDSGDWRAGIAAAALMAPPLRAPILLTDGERPAGGDLDRPRHAQADGRPAARRRAGDRGRNGARARRRCARGASPAATRSTLAAAIDALRAPTSAGRPSQNVVIVSAERAPRSPCRPRPGRRSPATPCCSRSATAARARRGRRSGGTSGRTSTCSARERVISASVERALRRLGRVQRIAGPHAGRRTRSRSRATPTRPSAGACATRATASCSRTRTARSTRRPRPRSAAQRQVRSAAAARRRRRRSRGPLENFLLDIQPGYRFDPVRGVYNHAWMLGDESAIERRGAGADRRAAPRSCAYGTRSCEVRRTLSGMSGAERPDRLAPEHRVTVDDVRELVGAGDPPLRAADPRPRRAPDRRPAARRPRPRRGRARDRAARAHRAARARARATCRTTSSPCRACGSSARRLE